ncbi:hypothetical protein HK103_007512 [Boothiomyces macroporosus]|uniref:Dynactin subunit 4 n=1 Tax=Boothiomyces macroporosus TaxID=261099 RepID=A0AAD5UBZ8_9FUNG|nr:hypothetical protein HK103_007512 [Boothiomyces macroporosus]
MDIERKDITEYEKLKEYYEKLLQYNRPRATKFEKQFFSSSFGNFGYYTGQRIKADKDAPSFLLKSVELIKSEPQKVQVELEHSEKIPITLYDEIDLDLDDTTTLKQRLEQITTGLNIVDVRDLKPLRVQLRTKNTKKCDCNKVLVKPDTKAQSLVFLSKSMLSGIVPKVSVLDFKPYSSNQFQMTLKYVNTSKMTMQIEVAQFEDPNIKLELNSSFTLQKYTPEWPKANKSFTANVVINASAELTVELITIRNKVSFITPDEYEEEVTLEYQYVVNLDKVKAGI